MAVQQAERWLEVYFSGREPGFTPPLHPMGSPFRQAVWELLLQIPYGQTTTYGALAKQLAEKHQVGLLTGCIFPLIMLAALIVMRKMAKNEEYCDYAKATSSSQSQAS